MNESFVDVTSGAPRDKSSATSGRVACCEPSPLGDASSEPEISVTVVCSTSAAGATPTAVGGAVDSTAGATIGAATGAVGTTNIPVRMLARRLLCSCGTRGRQVSWMSVSTKTGRELENPLLESRRSR